MKKKSIALSTTIVSWIHRLSWLVLFASCLTYPGRVQAQEAEAKIVNVTVNDERVKIRIKVKNENDQLVTSLTDENFKVYVNNEELLFKPQNWKNPQEAQQPSAWIIFLLDMSDSMAKRDKRGSSQTKLEGALEAIQKFTEATADRSSDTRVAVIPFGKPHGTSCPGYPVDETTLNRDSFLLVKSSELPNHLDDLASKKLCGSTNIYEPLSKSIEFFSQAEENLNLSLKKKVFWQSQSPQPRLSIILLSDGYHNTSDGSDSLSLEEEKEKFNNLLELLEGANDDIIVHTLGYGLTPTELADEYRNNGFSKPKAMREDLFYHTPEQLKLPSDKVPAEEFVDSDRLDEIASTTGGLCKISGDAQAVGNALRVFLDALLGEYEITYTDPNPIRAERHKVWVKVNGQHLPPAGLESDPIFYRITSFGWSIPPSLRLTMLAGTFIVMGIGGAVPFYFWGQYLKREALED